MYGTYSVRCGRKDGQALAARFKGEVKDGVLTTRNGIRVTRKPAKAKDGTQVQ